MTDTVDPRAMDRSQLTADLKAMIVYECQREISPDDIADDATLMGEASDVGLDSLDALQISLAVQRRYGKRIDGGNATRHALTSVNALADFILSP
jgi:acyl carrier protein